MIYIGIDPGADGGIAILDAVAGDEVWQTFKLRDLTEKEIASTLAFDCWPAAKTPTLFAVIEKIGAIMGAGKSSNLKLGMSYGFLRGCLVTHGVPFEEITPAKWQQKLSCRSKGDKKITRARAQQLFPSVAVTNATADAVLLAECARRLVAERNVDGDVKHDGGEGASGRRSSQGKGRAARSRAGSKGRGG